MKTRDLQAEARYEPFDESERAVTAPMQLSFEKVSFFDHVPLETVMISVIASVSFREYSGNNSN